MTTMGEERWMVMMLVINDDAAVDNDDSDGHSRWMKDVGWLDGGLAGWLAVRMIYDDLVICFGNDLMMI